jgi:hypothetical protein
MPAATISAPASMSADMPTVPSAVAAMPSAMPPAAPTIPVPVIAVPATPDTAIAHNAAGPVPRSVEGIAVDRAVWRRLLIGWCNGATTQARGHGERRNKLAHEFPPRLTAMCIAEARSIGRISGSPRPLEECGLQGTCREGVGVCGLIDIVC